MKIRNNKAHLMSGAALLLSGVLLLGASAARADTAAAAATDAADTGRIEEVTVTARKRSENVQQVPVPVTVLTTQ